MILVGLYVIAIYAIGIHGKCMRTYKQTGGLFVLHFYWVACQSETTANITVEMHRVKMSIELVTYMRKSSRFCYSMGCNFVQWVVCEKVYVILICWTVYIKQGALSSTARMCRFWRYWIEFNKISYFGAHWRLLRRTKYCIYSYNIIHNFH
jgi:hypothetical protein